jgi:hypothetical protein
MIECLLQIAPWHPHFSRRYRLSPAAAGAAIPQDIN